MKKLTLESFQKNLKNSIADLTEVSDPILIENKQGKDFIVLSREDYEKDQETLFVLQNNSLMNQIAESLKTHVMKNGYIPTKEELNEINSF
jgi:antitoxin YefM